MPLLWDTQVHCTEMYMQILIFITSFSQFPSRINMHTTLIYAAQVIVLVISSIFKAYHSTQCVCFFDSHQSLLAPLRSITLVANAVLATKFLNEKFERSKILGIILVVIGSVCSVLFGPAGSSEEITIEYIKSSWQNMIFIIFFAALSGLAAIDFIFVKLYELKNLQNTEDHQVIHGGNFLMMSYVSLAAYFGSVSMVCSL